MVAQQNNGINNIKALTDSIEAIVKNQHTPGLMVGITTKDSVLFSGGFGYADVAAKRKVNGETLGQTTPVGQTILSMQPYAETWRVCSTDPVQ